MSSQALFLAIPSPDVVINLFASASQMLGLLAVGGSGFLVSQRAGGGVRSTGSRPFDAVGTGAAMGGGGGSRTLAVVIGLWLLTGLSFWLYHLRVADAQSERLRMALTRPSQEAGRDVGDVSLVTLEFSAQLEHPRGWQTATLADRLEQDETLKLIDVREPEEIEMGTLPGAISIPYPELLRGGGELDLGPETVLICFSGNRSSELVELLGATHPDLGFVIGGFEKWMAEGRPLGRESHREQLRSLPAFAGGEVLLDSAEAADWLSQENILCVDVRYPADFEQGHLPGAINLPLRSMTRAEWGEAMNKLGGSRVLVPCYDKRSSFYALILGLRVTRAGGTFLGRYTLPHEYQPAVASTTRPYREAWARQRAGKTPYGMLVGGMSWILGALTDWAGVIGGTVLLALLARFLTLPLSWKAACDRWSEWDSAGALAEIRLRFQADPVRRERAMASLKRDLGLTPLRNVVGSLVQMVLFIALLDAVGSMGAAPGEMLGSLPWAADVSRPDPLGVWAVLCGLLCAALVLDGRLERCLTARSRGGLLALALGSGLLIGALVVFLTALQGLYLSVSLAWVMAQTKLARRRTLGPRLDSVARIRPLGQCAGQQDVGRKAERLGYLMKRGIRVPAGFVLTTRGVRELLAHCPEDVPSSQSSIEAQVVRAFRALGAKRVAVRSSGLAEDGEESSFAGVFDTRLNVSGEGLLRAIREVGESLSSDFARDAGSTDEGGGVLVQTMVPAEYAGVLFTEHPGQANCALVEWTRGLGEELVGGQVTPQAAVFGRLSGERVGGMVEGGWNPDSVVGLGRQIEEHLSVPQDVEWAFAEGEVWILQARDITVRAGESSGDDFEAERQRALDALRGEPVGEPLLTQEGVAELLPDATPFSASFMAQLWEPGSTVDLACRSVGMRYLAKEQEPARLHYLFGQVWTHLGVARQEDAGLSALAGYRLTKGVAVFEWEAAALKARAEQQAPIDQALNLERLSDRALLSHYQQRLEQFTHQSYVTAERINVAAEWMVSGARARLEAAGLPASEYLCPGATTLSRAYDSLGEIAEGSRPEADFLEPMHHRSPHDFEWSEPRYGEDHRLLKALLGQVGDSRTPHDREVGPTHPPLLSHILRTSVERACRLQELKEEAKHFALVDLAQARRALYELACRALADAFEPDDIWHLEPADVADLWDERAGHLHLPDSLAQKILASQRRREALESVNLPLTLSALDLERIGHGGTVIEFSQGRRKALEGQRVAGVGEAVGQVRVCRHVRDLAHFCDGEVLVTRFTDPSWSPVFARAGGLVTEVGGWLSHAAILAREKQLVAIVGAHGALSSLHSGMWVRLTQAGRIEIITEAAAREGRAQHHQSQLAPRALAASPRQAASGDYSR